MYFRDPLLDKICDRITDLDRPAYVKNSELVFVAANSHFAALFDLEPSALVGTGIGEYSEIEALMDLGEKERTCIVFGEDQRGAYADPFGKGRFAVEIERFTLADGQTFVYCVFNRLSSIATAPAQTAASAVAIAPLAMSTGPMIDFVELGSELAQQIIDTAMAGIFVFNKENRLVYYNQKIEEYYGSVIGGLRIGMTLGEIIGGYVDYWISQSPVERAQYRAVREQWVNDRVALHDSPNHVDILQLGDKKWVQCINRRLPDGTLIGLRVDVTEMKLYETELKTRIEEASLYKELLNRLPVAAFARGPDQKLAFVNQAYAEMFGRPCEDLIGTGEHDLFGEFADAIHTFNRNTLVDGVEYEQEEETPVVGGKTVSTIVKTGRMITGNNTPYVVGTIVDISAIRQREILLQEANDRAESVRRDFENIISSIGVGLIILDKEMNIQLMNETYRDTIWGAGALSWQGDVLNRPFRELLRNNYLSGRQPDTHAELEAYLDDRLREIQSGRIQTREILFHDETVTLYSGIPLSNGKFLLCYVDLTELRRRDRELARANAEVAHAYSLVSNATEAMPEGLLVLEDGKVAFTNSSLSGLLEIPVETLEVGLPWEDSHRATLLRHPDATEESVENSITLFRGLISEKVDISQDFQLDAERWIHVEMRTNDDGQTVIIFSDKTGIVKRERDLKLLIAKAEAADRAKSEFLANMSHEIRTPMNGILGMAELLSKTSLDTRQKTFIDIVVKSGTALLTIINDILDFSRLDAGQMQIKNAPFDPGEAVEDVATLLASRAAEKDIELIIRRAHDLPGMIMGDAGRFRQIITNLIGNAVKFTDRGHVVTSIHTVTTAEGQVMLEVEIEDTGVGIPEAKIASIFDKFSQVDGSSTRRHEGTGLGLAISQRLASMQGGKISVRSIEGHGSAFTLNLPLVAAIGATRRKTLPVNVEGARILVIDDNEVNRTILLEQVTDWGFEGVAAADGLTGLSILEAAREHDLSIDAIILDWQMPGLNGAEVARRIRANPAHEDTAIVFLTSVDIVDSDEDPSLLRVQAHLMKPARSAILRDTIVDVIRTCRLRKPVNVAQMLRPGAPATLNGLLQPSRASVHFIEEHALRASLGTTRNAAPPVAAGITVLVAEDNEVNQIVYSQILEAAGIDYHIVPNGAEAVAQWRTLRPSLIIMDVSMPVLDGLQASAQIRALEAEGGGHTPILGVTAHALEGDREMCLESGMDDYMTKPISPERLEEKIRHWVGAFALLKSGSGL